MPLYSFVCEECGQRFDKRLPFSQAEERPVCPNGHPQVRRELALPTIVFKGSGFYATDHRKPAAGEHSR